MTLLRDQYTTEKKRAAELLDMTRQGVRVPMFEILWALRVLGEPIE
jgi:exoribonuclease II